MTQRRPREPRNPSRVFLAKLFGLRWHEIEREYRRLERHRKALETTGTDATGQTCGTAAPGTEEDR